MQSSISQDCDKAGAPVKIVYVIDDDGDLRKSLHFLLGTRDLCVSPFASGVDFLTELPELAPAPIILDIRMPRMDGTQVLAELVARNNNWPVIVLSGHGEISVAVKSLKLGAVDYLEKPVTAPRLLESIDAAFGLLDRVQALEITREEALQRIALLTPREAEVVNLLCDGRSNKQVAFDLSISPRTVEMHRANALRQLNLRTVVEAVSLLNAAGRPAPATRP